MFRKAENRRPWQQCDHRLMVAFLRAGLQTVNQQAEFGPAQSVTVWHGWLASIRKMDRISSSDLIIC